MRLKNGTKVKSSIRLSNPRALEVVNERCVRDHLGPATAAAIIILESTNKRSFRDSIITKPAQAVQEKSVEGAKL
jgi:hypothetical protein